MAHPLHRSSRGGELPGSGVAPKGCLKDDCLSLGYSDAVYVLVDPGDFGVGVVALDIQARQREDSPEVADGTEELLEACRLSRGNARKCATDFGNVARPDGARVR